MNKEYSDIVNYYHLRCVRGTSFDDAIVYETDNVTGVIRDLNNDVLWSTDINDTAMNWQDSIGYCESLEHAGSTNWRLPNINELKSIVDYSSIEPTFKSGITVSTGYSFWSSTTNVSANNNAWSLGSDFVIHYADKTVSQRVRCIKDRD